LWSTIPTQFQGSIPGKSGGHSPLFIMCCEGATTTRRPHYPSHYPRIGLCVCVCSPTLNHFEVLGHMHIPAGALVHFAALAHLYSNGTRNGIYVLPLEGSPCKTTLATVPSISGRGGGSIASVGIFPIPHGIWAVVRGDRTNPGAYHHGTRDQVGWGIPASIFCATRVNWAWLNWGMSPRLYNLFFSVSTSAGGTGM